MQHGGALQIVSIRSGPNHRGLTAKMEALVDEALQMMRQMQDSLRLLRRKPVCFYQETKHRIDPMTMTFETI